MTKLRLKTNFIMIMVLSLLLVGSIGNITKNIELPKKYLDDLQVQSLEAQQDSGNTPIIDEEIKVKVEETMTGVIGGFLENNENKNDIYYSIHSSKVSVGFAVSKIHFLIPYTSPGNHSEKVSTNAIITFPGSNPILPVAQDPLNAYMNYFKGSDPSQWIVNKPYYSSLIYKNLYPNIDLVYKIQEGKLKYEFLVYPGGNVNDIQIKWHGLVSLELLASGLQIQVKTPSIHFSFLDTNPIIFQGYDRKDVITGCFNLINTKTYGFSIPVYDQDQILIIDPTLSMHSILGGTGDDRGYSLAIDSSGDIYVTGETSSLDFYTTAFIFDEIYNGGNSDVFVFKIHSSGGLWYSTYIGGSGDDKGLSIAVDNEGYAYITGETDNTTDNYPTTPDAYNKSHNGDKDIFISKFAPDGKSLNYSTFLGGSGFDIGNSIEIDNTGNAYVTGKTENASVNFPTTIESYEPTHKGLNDAFIAKLSSNGSILLNSTFLGGSGDDEGNSIAVDNNGDIYVTGSTNEDIINFPTTFGSFNTTHSGAKDVFILKMASNGSNLFYSTLIGGSLDEVSNSIVLDNAGNSYITGHTTSTNFPITPGAVDKIKSGIGEAFATKLAKNGSTLLFSTHLSGDISLGSSLAVDPEENVYITGVVYGGGLQTTPEAYDTTSNGGEDAFFIKLAANGSSLIYSTYIGGSETDWGYGIGLDSLGNIYISGCTQGLLGDFIGPQDFDVFVISFNNLPEKPSNIEDLSIIEDTSNQTILTWTKPFDGNSPILEYRIYRGTSSGVYALLDKTLNEFFVDTDISSGQTYYYVVTAVNRLGESSFSNEVNMTSFRKPDSPQSLTATGGELFVYLSWTAPGSDGGSAITGYHVYRGTSTGVYTLIFIASETNYNDTLVVGVTYFYIVTAINAVGESETSSEVSATPTEPTVIQPFIPSAPQSLTATAGELLVSLNWTAPSNDGGSAISGYQVYRGTNSGVYTLIFIASETNYNDTLVNGGVTYYYVVTAMNAVGESDVSSEVIATPTEPTIIQPVAPSTPQSLSATAGELFVYLSWTIPSSDGGSAITGYHIYRGTSSGEYTITFVASNTNYNDTLVFGVTYYYVVTAINAIGESETASEVSATPAEPTAIQLVAPGAPQSLTATAGELFVYLTWTIPSSDGGSAITGYHVYRRTSSGEYVLLGTTTSITYNDTLVLGEISFYYVVTAINAVGESVYSNEVNATPTGATTPKSGSFPDLFAVLFFLGTAVFFTRKKNRS